MAIVTTANDDPRLAEYLALVKAGKDDEAAALLAQIRAGAEERRDNLDARKEVLEIRMAELQSSGVADRRARDEYSYAKIYRDLLIYYRDAIAYAKWASHSKKVLREAKKARRKEAANLAL